jgi:hypothetical protein
MISFQFEHWPTEYPVITQYFGANSQNYAQFGLPGHEGVDIRAPMGSKVFAVAPGRVFRIHINPHNHNYGIHVRVQHQNGYQTIYAHLQKVLVRENQEVEAGYVLGLADNTGNSFGSHLHLTLKKEGARYRNWPHNIIDPTPFLLPLLGWQEPVGPFLEGWALTAGLTIAGNLAQANSGGITLRLNANETALVPGGTIMIRVAEPNGENKLLHMRVKVPRAAIGLELPDHPIPDPDPPTTIATVDGWAWIPYLNISGRRATVANPGINLRSAPDRNAPNIGLVRRHSTVAILGTARNEYLPVQVRRSDFMGPVLLPELLPLTEVEGTVEVPDDSYLGWASTRFLSPVGGRQANASRFGATLRDRPSENSRNIGLIKAFAAVIIVGYEENEFTPVVVRRSDVLNAPASFPPVHPPQILPPDSQSPPLPQPIHDSTPGWTFTGSLQISGDSAVTGSRAINLHDAPRRDSAIIGHIPPRSEIIVTGPAHGEFTAVRVNDTVLLLPEEQGSRYDPPLLGKVQIGLHASADPAISPAEHQEFAKMRPGIIKLLSFHPPEDVRRLATDHPEASWIVRAFLDFGQRNITPERFFEYTCSDVERTLLALQGKDVVVELHNEPNIQAEGLGYSWPDGVGFNRWWLQLLQLYRERFPTIPFIYPGLSPGSTVRDIKQDHIRFIEASREAVEAANGLGVHIYWSDVYPMQRALDVLDDYISRFRSIPIWISEASNNSVNVIPQQKALEYLRFWQELQQRPVVQGVTYFVASASNRDFASEVWVGRGIAAIVGRR